jgi:cytochrome b
MHMRQVKVWDLFVRLSHWGLGLVVLGSFLTSEKDSLTAIHVKIGLGVLALVLARVAWGFFGSEPARFRAFVRRPREVVACVRDLALGRPALHLSHNPLGGAMVVAILTVLLGLVATGAIAYAGPEFAGPLTGVVGKRMAHDVKELHEALSTLLLGMIGAHVAGVLISSWRERQNLIAGMITGWKRAPEARAGPAAEPPRHASHTIRAVAALVVGALAAVTLALCLGVPVWVSAASPVATELLREYEAQARRQRPGFTGFSVEEGRRLYFTEFVQAGRKVSCSSCHTANVRGRGLTPAGKVVEPLAPAANPARLTDRSEVEKWFKRNCKQVVGRECTAEEKGHVITWLLGA